MAKQESNSDKISSKKVECKNCKTLFIGKYCPNCGQSVYEFDRPFKFLLSDLTRNMFAFDTRFWKSFTSLIVHPGKYTENYIKGYRVRYMPPFQFYVFMSFIFFLLLSIHLKENLRVDEKDRLSIDSLIAHQMDSLEATQVNSPTTGKLDLDIHETDPSVKIFNSEALTVAGAKKLADTVRLMIKNPGPYISSFLKFLSWSLFFLMPVYACFLWLFFRKSKKHYFCHLILAINQHTYIFLLGSFLLGIKLLLPTREYTPEDYLLWLVPAYMYIGSLQLYKRRWYSTLIKELSILLLYMLTLAIIFVVIVFLWAASELGIGCGDRK